MTDLRKAAEVALEALELGDDISAEQMSDALEALRQALSNEFNPDWNQVEALQESLREHMAEIQRLRQALPQLEQEPVGQLQEDAYGRGQVLWFNKPLDQTMLYTAPPKREWQGLTDDEIYDYADKFLYQHGSNYAIKSFGKAIEAKLKEKNT